MASLLKEIQSIYSSLSQKEKNIADYILSDPDGASHSSIQEMAEKTGVSVSTITRFAKKAACSSFVEMKVKLASGSEKSGEEGIEQTLLSSYREMLADVRSLSDNQAFDQVMTFLREAKRLFIYGLGSSGLAAQELNYRLSRMGFVSEAVTDPHLMVIKSTLQQPGDVIIAFSRSGQTVDLLRSISKGKEKGAKLIALTAFGNTPLTNLSDAILWTIHPARNNFLLTGLDMSMLYLIDRISLHFLSEPEREAKYLETVEAITSTGISSVKKNE
ncbi:MurR/RpiR family transcriptional regulator [Fictibacillus fluitans]|uniref:MurR/RpiR family transcriptional regulator n=1 Tax=Fictibacillus fluitans TaxID=3058422 RepID=A0ABT8HT89_9BACL|nr:MurR/RpiR family transcriptional regulator [Fictibacillus sp. NE201]MDN4523966.1 MurR/RpiR family transcriptional regulator [Fictibacillus sp. NE201]